MTHPSKSWSLPVSLCSLLCVAVFACGRDDSASVSGSTEPDTEASASGNTTTGPVDPDATSSPDGMPTSTSALDTGSTTAEPSDTEDSSAGDDLDGAIVREDFEGPDGAPWPAPWIEIGDAVRSYDLSDGRGRLSGETQMVARILLPGYEEVDVDVEFVVEFEAWEQQGFGFYVRNNGGALQQTPVFGQGYAVYVEGGFQRAIGVWREIDGVEELLTSIGEPLGAGLEDATPYRIRFQCEQVGDDATALRVKIWRDRDAEPDAWQIEHVDSTPILQNTAGTFAVDIYNYVGTGSVYVDDIEIRPL